MEKNNNTQATENTQLEMVQTLEITVPGMDLVIPANSENPADTNLKKEEVTMDTTEKKAAMMQIAEEKGLNSLIEQEMENTVEAEPVELEIQDITVQIPQDSQGIEEIPEEIQAMAEQGYFSPVYGTAHIVNRLNGKLYAYVHVDQKGSRTVVFRQQYDDGSYSAEFTIKQEDLLMVVGSVNDPLLEKEAKTSRNRIVRGYMSRCSGRETLNMLEVMRVLVEALSKLPIVSDCNTELSKQDLYEKVLDAIKGDLHLARRKGYFSFGDGAVEKAAQSLGMSTTQLLARLKRERLLYLTESCKGYQAKVPIGRSENGKPIYGWQYCLLDFEYFVRLNNPEKYGPADELAQPLHIAIGWGI